MFRGRSCQNNISLYYPDVCFKVRLRKTAATNRYMSIAGTIGITSYSSGTIGYALFGKNEITDSKTLGSVGYNSLEANPAQCRKPYSGTLAISYTNEYGVADGSPIITAEFDSSTLGLNF